MTSALCHQFICGMCHIELKLCSLCVYKYKINIVHQTTTQNNEKFIIFHLTILLFV